MHTNLEPRSPQSTSLRGIRRYLILCLNIFLGAVIYTSVDILHAIDMDGLLLLLLASIITVVMIIVGSSLNGFFDERYRTRSADRNTASLLNVLFSRESVLPLFLLTALYMNDQISPAIFLTVWNEKADLVILILMFSVIAEGIRESGYFRYMALRIIDVASGLPGEIDLQKLTLSLFLLCSLLSYFFTNDIVVLIITPIALEICRFSKIRDARLVLIVVFIAANAMAMGLLIGPPKNIIVAREMGLNFFEYAAIMLVPSLLTAFVGLLATSLLARRFRESELHHLKIPVPKFTRNMRSWLTVHILTVAFVAANSFWGVSFLFAGAIVIPGSIFLIWRENRGGSIKWHKFIYGKLFAHAPIQIFIFAFVFFVVSEQFGRLLFESHYSHLEIAGTLLREGSLLTSGAIIAFTGFATNILNDLPASALISEALARAGIHSSSGIFNNILVIQSFLVGLGVGAYLGPTATLAAIIWFHQMNRYESQDVRNPTWLDMLRYGTVYFLLTVCATSLLLPILLPISALAVAVSPPQNHSLVQWGSLQATLLDVDLLFSLVVVVAIVFWIRNLLRRKLSIGIVRTVMKALVGR